MTDPLLDAEAEAKVLMDAAGQLETLAQERDTARELCRDAIQERDQVKAVLEQIGADVRAGPALRERLAAAEAKVKDLEQLLAFGRAVSPSLLDSVSSEDARILSAWAAVRHHELDAARLARNAAEARVAELEAELAALRPGASP